MTGAFFVEERTLKNPDVLRLVPSAVRAFRECPHSYGLSYVQPLPESERLPVPALALGSAVHAAIARFLRMGGWERRSLDELLGMLAMVWEPAAFGDEQAERDAYARATELLIAFFSHPYPPDVERELGVERNVSWLKPRRGILAAGKLDRVCLRRGGVLEVIDWKTGRPPDRLEPLQRDVQALFYRTLIADSFRWLAPSRVVVSFRYIGAAVTAALELDVVDFLDAWEEVLVTAEAIREGRARYHAGTPLADAFALNRGPGCRGCRFAAHCDGVEAAALAGDDRR